MPVPDQTWASTDRAADPLLGSSPPPHILQAPESNNSFTMKDKDFSNESMASIAIKIPEAEPGHDSTGISYKSSEVKPGNDTTDEFMYPLDTDYEKEWADGPPQEQTKEGSED